ncbi:MAG: hypothetical protein V8Q84_07865 [Bilophila sp.]
MLSLVLTLGLFMAPSGKPGTPLRRKDFLFISLLLFIFGVAAKGAYLFVGKIVQPQDMALAIHFFPVAGAAGLCALIFAARRYCVVGLLVSLFACVMLKAELPLFLLLPVVHAQHVAGPAGAEPSRTWSSASSRWPSGKSSSPWAAAGWKASGAATHSCAYRHCGAQRLHLADCCLRSARLSKWP